VEALEDNKCLTSLTMVGGRAGVPGAYKIAKLLENNNTLSNLNLSRNRIGSEGARRISRALKTNSSLTRLDLSENYIDNASIALMVRFLENNTTITSLKLDKKSIRIQAILVRNKEFLKNAVDDLSQGNSLTAKQRQTLLAHLSNGEKDILEIFPENKRNEYYIANNIDAAKAFDISLKSSNKPSMQDTATEIGGFLTPSEVETMNIASKGSRFGQSTKVNNVETFELHEIVQASSNFIDLVQQANNMVFIKKALKDGKPFEQVMDNIKIINDDPQLCEFFKEVKERGDAKGLKDMGYLGHMLALNKEALSQTMEIIKHPECNDFLKDNPKQLATIAKSTSDPEKLLRTVLILKKYPELLQANSLKSVVNATDADFATMTKKTTSHKR
jgi:hypothetical protein